MSNPRRIYSIDVFRGITIAFMIIVNNPGSWSHVYPPLLHAKWHGCTPTDLVFPFFLFLVGASMRFAFVKWHYYPSMEFYKHIFIYLGGLREVLMRQFTVSALVEGYRIDEQITAVSIHHAIKLMQAKYSNARNVYVRN